MSLSARPASAGTASPAHAEHQSSSTPHSMAGLVLGVSVDPTKGRDAATSPARAAHEIRLLAQSSAKRFGPLAGLGYVVQEGQATKGRSPIQSAKGLTTLRKLVVR